MQSVLRRYSGEGAKELFDLLEKRKAKVDELMGSVKSLVAYTLVHSGDSGFSVTVCQDKAAIDEGVQKAKDWIAKKCGEHRCGRAGGDGGIGHFSINQILVLVQSHRAAAGKRSG